MSLGSHVVPRVSRFPGYHSQPECPKMFLNALKASIYVAKYVLSAHMPIYIGFLDIFGCPGGAQVVPRWCPGCPGFLVILVNLNVPRCS